VSASAFCRPGAISMCKLPAARCFLACGDTKYDIINSYSINGNNKFCEREKCFPAKRDSLPA
jgi:hypothetical protein